MNRLEPHLAPERSVVLLAVGERYFHRVAFFTFCPIFALVMAGEGGNSYIGGGKSDGG